MTINITPQVTPQNPSAPATAATLPLPVGAAAASTVPATAPAAANPTFPTLKAITRKSLPKGVASNVKQFAGLLLDTSSSMSLLNKINEVNAAVSLFIRELANPANKDGFRVSVIEFDNSARLICSAESAETLSVPSLQASGGTNFDAPINMAIAEIEAFANRPNPEGWHYLRPQVFFMSDGQASVADKNIQRLHELADVTAIAYGSDADEAMLSRIASDGNVHVIGTDGTQLRTFLAQVGKTMTKTMAQNI